MLDERGLAITLAFEGNDGLENLARVAAVETHHRRRFDDDRTKSHPGYELFEGIFDVDDVQSLPSSRDRIEGWEPLFNSSGWSPVKDSKYLARIKVEREDKCVPIEKLIDTVMAKPYDKRFYEKPPFVYYIFQFAVHATLMPLLAAILHWNNANRNVTIHISNVTRISGDDVLTTNVGSGVGLTNLAILLFYHPFTCGARVPGLRNSGLRRTLLSLMCHALVIYNGVMKARIFVLELHTIS